MCRELNISKGIFTDLKMGRKKTLASGTLSKVSAYLGVTTDYLLGIVDQYGLTGADWAAIGALFKDSRISMGFSRELAVDGEVVTVDQLAAFEDNGSPLTPNQLAVACGMIGLDPTIVFSLWSDKLWGDKKKPAAEIDDELADELELLRSRPDVRTLLHASRDMTPAQVEKMAEFMLSMKGEDNEKSD